MTLFKGRVDQLMFLKGTLLLAGIYILGVYVVNYYLHPGLISPLFWLQIIINIFVFLQGISLTMRRWHDLGKTGWLTVLNFIPVVNLITYIYLIFTKGQKSTNKFGKPSASFF